ncbi:MAG: type II/IV secretion system protein [Gemmatimonadetes bacterium]|nr:type II/IV secretion system protein [Gemmatimonadota bacterium]
MPPGDLPTSFQLPSELSRDFLIRHGLCPVERSADGDLLLLAAPDADLTAAEEIAAALACGVRVSHATSETVAHSIERLTADRDHRDAARSVAEPDDFAADVRALATQPPVVRFVNLLLREAHEATASDIHLDSTRGALEVRMRVDGVLMPAVSPPAGQELAVLSRLKMLAALDIAERRRPQDGRLRMRLGGGELDVRVSMVPTVHGESAVLRLLDRGTRPASLSDLGMSDAELAMVAQACHRTSGMVLATGPTGSGKTSTLYAALQQRDRAREKIMTVEDPVEYHLAGITQVPVQQRAGVTFANILRSLLRQDPDVLMIGEMRDAETAEIATQAAMTGHLVLTTLHTIDALGAIGRLHDLGIAPYLIAATIDTVIAQRLLRVNCERCTSPVDIDPALCATLLERPVGRVTGARGAGCDACRGSGFRGRMGVFEVLAVSDAMKDAIAGGASRDGLRALAHAGGHPTLRDSAWRLVLSGRTTIEEALRVLS